MILAVFRKIQYRAFTVLLARDWSAPLAWLGLKTYNVALSPVINRNGARCPHEILHGDTGCSTASLRAMEALPLAQARTAIADRLAACKVALTQLTAEQLAQARTDCSGSCCDRSIITNDRG